MARERATEEITEQKALEVLQKQRDAKLQEFQAKLSALLTEYNVTLQVSQHITVVQK